MTAEVALQAVQGDEVVLGAVGSALALDEADEVVLGEMGDEVVLGEVPAARAEVAELGDERVLPGLDERQDVAEVADRAGTSWRTRTARTSPRGGPPRGAEVDLGEPRARVGPRTGGTVQGPGGVRETVLRRLLVGRANALFP